ncbi:hypothetical protein GFL91_02830 [Rhizobium leguminosarum bv. viciae]|uniref:Uncharacterized protein n=1 Tax=Rhizobium leguminosarum bv. viciae TaxID=387 RepID=A0A4R0BVL9_RHILV|nr:hypothetical protein [Rhizobium leguminosarum bv. viciae]NKM43941.1 hypothetical protein [Rhizobium leguminosarum bv. viciae]NKM98461.1 hypothetical protein [Rhizobium leguminosarum bv. viciae]TBY77760.1 hypothetical protein E0H51_10045 [Rhizobium leguminosarum bv. viciae]TBY84680.1 hypothetical protein E0H32_04970 [Rhizobium leguminosarum bv. viciae]
MEMHLYTDGQRWVAGGNRVAGICELTMAPASRRRLTTPITSLEPRVTIPSPVAAVPSIAPRNWRRYISWRQL